MDSRFQKAKISSLASKCEPIQNDRADRCVGEKMVLRALCGLAKWRKFSFFPSRMVAEAPDELTFRRVIVAITLSLRIPDKHKLTESLPHQRGWFDWFLLSCWLSWVVILPRGLVEPDCWIVVYYPNAARFYRVFPLKESKCYHFPFIQLQLAVRHQTGISKKKHLAGDFGWWPWSSWMCPSILSCAL